MSPKNKPNIVPEIGGKQIKLLERLSNASGVSGNEGEVREIVLAEVKYSADEVKVDALGNVLVTRRGKAAGKKLRVMLAAHMDEVGFMLVEDNEEGIFRFELVGGIDIRQLPGKAVYVGPEHLPGVIGARPIHLTTREERNNMIPLEGLRIDLGLGGSAKAKTGEWAVFGTRFYRSGPSLYGKALDDRLGVATLIELVKSPPPNIDLLAVFSVQEEIGARGARVAAYALDPQLAVVLDATPALDQPMWDGRENTQYNTRLDAGPAIYLADSSTLSDPRLVRHFIDTAEAKGIPYQARQPGGGGTDAGAIHRQKEGVPSISISVPCRYTHTAVSIARLRDWKDTLALVYAGLNGLTPSVLE